MKARSALTYLTVSHVVRPQQLTVVGKLKQVVREHAAHSAYGTHTARQRIYVFDM